jgi:hypothetical protein
MSVSASSCVSIGSDESFGDVAGVTPSMFSVKVVPSSDTKF